MSWTHYLTPPVPLLDTINIHTFRTTARTLLSSCISRTRCCLGSCAVLRASMPSNVYLYELHSYGRPRRRFQTYLSRDAVINDLPRFLLGFGEFSRRLSRGTSLTNAWRMPSNEALKRCAFSMRYSTRSPSDIYRCKWW